LIAVVQDSLGAEYLILCDEDKQISLSSMKYLIEQRMTHPKNEHLVRVMISDSRKKDHEPILLCMVVNYTQIVSKVGR
jgi:hypothetical protein